MLEKSDDVDGMEKPSSVFSFTGGLKHPVTGEPLTLAQAVAGGLLMLAKGLFVRPDTGEEMSLEEAMQKQYLSGQLFSELNQQCDIVDPNTGKKLTLLEATKLGLFCPETGSFKDPESNKLLSRDEASKLGFKLLQKVSTQPQLVSTLEPALNLYSAIRNKLVDANTGLFTEKDYKSISLSEAYAKGFITSRSSSHSGVSLTDLIEQNLVDESGVVSDQCSGASLTVDQAIQKSILDPNVVEIVNPQNNEKVTLAEALELGIIDSNKGKYNDKQNKRLSFNVANEQLLICQPFTLKDCHDLNILSDDGFIADPLHKDNISILTAIDRRILDIDLKSVRNTQNNRLLSLSEAFECSIITPQGKYYNLERNNVITLNEAVRRGFITSVKTRSIFNVDVIQDPKSGSFINLKLALQSKILDPKTGKIFNPISGGYLTLDEAVAKKLVRPEIINTLKLPIGIMENSGKELNVIEAVLSGRLDPATGQVIDPSTGFALCLEEAVSRKSISPHGAATLKGLMNVTITTTTITKLVGKDTTDKVSLECSIINKISDESLNNSNIINDFEIISNDYPMVHSTSSTCTQDSVIKSTSSGVNSPTTSDTISPTKSTSHEPETFSSDSKNRIVIEEVKSPQDSIDSAMDGLDDAEETSVISPSDLNLSHGELFSGKLLEIPRDGWSLKTAIELDLLDTTSGLFRVPGSDRLVSFKECIELGILNPPSMEIVNPVTGKNISVSRAFDKHIVDDTGHYLCISSDLLTMQNALDKGYIIYVDEIQQTTKHSYDPSSGCVQTIDGTNVDLMVAVQTGLVHPEHVCVKDPSTEAEINFADAVSLGIIDDKSGEYVGKGGVKMNVKEAAKLGLIGIGAIIGAPVLIGALAAKAVKSKLDESKIKMDDPVPRVDKFSAPKPDTNLSGNTHSVEIIITTTKTSNDDSETDDKPKLIQNVVVINPLTKEEFSVSDALNKKLITQDQLSYALDRLPDATETEAVTTIKLLSNTKRHVQDGQEIATVESETEIETITDLSDDSSRDTASLTTVTEVVFDPMGLHGSINNQKDPAVSYSTQVIQEMHVESETVISDPKTGEEHSLNDALALGIITKEKYDKMLSNASENGVNTIMKTITVTEMIPSTEETVLNSGDIPEPLTFHADSGTVSSRKGNELDLLTACSLGVLEADKIYIKDPMTNDQISIDKAIKDGIVDVDTKEYIDSTGKRMSVKEATRMGLMGLAAVLGAPVLAGMAAAKLIKSNAKNTSLMDQVRSSDPLSLTSNDDPRSVEGRIIRPAESVPWQENDVAPSADRVKISEHASPCEQETSFSATSSDNPVNEESLVPKISGYSTSDAELKIDSKSTSSVIPTSSDVSESAFKGDDTCDSAVTADIDSQSTVTADIDSQSTVPDGIDSQSAVTTVVDSQSAVTAGIDSQSAVTAGIDSQSAVTAGVDSQSSVTAGVDSQSSVTAGVDSLSSVTAGVDSQSSVTAGIDSQFTPADNKIDQLISVENNDLPEDQLKLTEIDADGSSHDMVRASVKAFDKPAILEGEDDKTTQEPFELVSSDGALKLQDGTEVDVDEAYCKGLIDPKYLTVTEPSSGRTLSVEEAIEQGIVDKRSGELVDKSGTKISLKNAAKMGLLGVAAVIGSPLIAGALAAKAIQKELKSKRVETLDDARPETVALRSSPAAGYAPAECATGAVAGTIKSNSSNEERIPSVDGKTGSDISAVDGRTACATATVERKTISSSAADGGKTVSPSAADDGKTVSLSAADDGNTASPSAADERKHVSPSAADEGKTFSGAANEGKPASPCVSDGEKTYCEADEVKTASPSAADERKTVSPSAADEGKTASPSAADEGKTASLSAADQEKIAFSSAADEGKTASPTAAVEGKTTSPTVADEGKTAPPTAADEGKTASSAADGENTTSPTAADGEKTTSSSTANEGKTASPSAADEENTASPTSVD